MIRRRAFTLVETLISAVITGVLIVAALQAVGQLARVHAKGVARTEVSVLARELANEIHQARGQDAETPGGWGPEAGEGEVDRLGFDDVDDYDGWTRSPPEHRDGEPVAGYDGWTRAVTVRPVDAADLADAAGDNGLVRIGVTITDPDGVATTLWSLRATGGLRDPISPVAGSVTPGLTIRIVDADGVLQTRDVALLGCPPGGEVIVWGESSWGGIDDD